MFRTSSGFQPSLRKADVWRGGRKRERGSGGRGVARRARAHPTHEKDEVEATTPTSGALPLRSPPRGADPETRVAGWSQHVQRPSNGPAPGTRRVLSHRSHIRSVEGVGSSATAAPEVPAPSEADIRAKPFQKRARCVLTTVG